MVLRARAFAHDAKVERAFDLDADDLDVRLVVQRIRLAEPPVFRRVLGLGLADVTDDMREAYDVPDYVHVLILRPVRPGVGSDGQRWGF